MGSSKLIFKGSSGCVFRPQIKCKKSISKTKTQKPQIWGKDKSKITKLMFNTNNKEYDFNKIIKKIKNYKSWAIVWSSICESQNYSELVKDNDINECLRHGNMDLMSGHTLGIKKKSRFVLHQGDYGGITLDQYSKNTLSKDILTSQSKFNEYFLKIFRIMKNIFYGLTELSKHGICHHDINIRNIIIKNNKSYIIDYDISLKIKNVVGNKFLKKRMNSEYSNYRIYEAYPFEYIYYSLKSSKSIIREQDNIKSYKSLIGYYELYIPINEGIFGIDTNNTRLDFLNEKLKNITKPRQKTRNKRKTKNKTNITDSVTDLTKLMQKIDIYSMGMMILIIFFDGATRTGIQVDEVIKRLRSPELKSYMDLIRDMIQFRYQDRITCEKAYDRYLNLIR